MVKIPGNALLRILPITNRRFFFIEFLLKYFLQEIQKIELSESVDRDREEDAKMFKEIMDNIRYYKE